MSTLRSTDLLTDVLKESANPGSRSGLINQQKGSNQFSVIKNGSLVAPSIGKYPKTFLSDIRPLMLNAALFELARVGISDFIADPLTADSYRSLPKRIVTPHLSPMSYICLRAGDYFRHFDLWEVIGHSKSVTSSSWSRERDHQRFRWPSGWNVTYHGSSRSKMSTK